jgi:hypothetical protein
VYLPCSRHPFHCRHPKKGTLPFYSRTEENAVKDSRSRALVVRVGAGFEDSEVWLKVLRLPDDAEQQKKSTWFARKRKLASRRLQQATKLLSVSRFFACKRRGSWADSGEFLAPLLREPQP